MGVLEAVLADRRAKRQESQQAMQSIINSVSGVLDDVERFKIASGDQKLKQRSLDLQQQSITNALAKEGRLQREKDEDQRISLAKGGLTMNDQGKISRDPSLKSISEQIIETAELQKALFEAGVDRNLFQGGGPISAIPQNQPTSLPGQIINSAQSQGSIPVQQPQALKPTKFDRFGRPVGFEEAGSSPQERAQEVKQKAGQRLAVGSFGQVAGATREIAETVAGSIKEGGSGNIVNKKLGEFALFFGGAVGDEFPETAALPGLKTEVIAKMMPMLTQQGDQKGSVRLVESIFRKLELTLPQGQTGPIAGRSQMEATLRNQYRNMRAANQLKIFDEVDKFQKENPKASESELEAFKDDMAQKIQKLTGTIEIQGEELQALDIFIEETLSPMDDLIAERAGVPYFKTVEEAINSNYTGRARIGGRFGRVG